MQVFEITVGSVDDAVKERIARMLCPDEDHPPPCPVPWSFTYRDDTPVLAVVADHATAADVARQVRTLTGHAATVAEADPADHDTLVEQYRVERELRL